MVDFIQDKRIIINDNLICTMNQDIQDKLLDDALRLMEQSENHTDKPWDSLQNPDTQKDCRDLMDIRFAMYAHKAKNEFNLENALSEFKTKQHNRQYTKQLILWVSAIAAIYIGVIVFLNDSFIFPHQTNEILAFQADTLPQEIVLSTDKGEKIILNESVQLQTEAKTKTKTSLNYSKLPTTTTPIIRTLLQTHKIVIPRGKTFKLVLSDSTEVWLNADSKLVYPTEFVENERSVYLQGEAYFKVAKGNKPFIVKTDYLQTQVLGTEFNIRTYSPEDVHVTLVKGKVRVSSLDNFTAVNLTPGKDASLCPNGKFELTDVNSDSFTYWKDGYFYFDQLPLLDIMKSIGKWYNLNVVFRNEEAMKINMHFMANRNDKIEKTMRLMNRLKKVTLTLHNGTIYID